MESQQAIIEFVNLLMIGSDALKSIVQTIEPAARELVMGHLVEVEAIAKRLGEIGEALEKVAE